MPAPPLLAAGTRDAMQGLVDFAQMKQQKAVLEVFSAPQTNKNTIDWLVNRICELWTHSLAFMSYG